MSVEKVTIKKIYRDEKDTKYGKKTLTTIYVQEYPERRISGFVNVPSWKEGDKVMVELIPNGDYTNFKAADSSAELEARVRKLEREMAAIKGEEIVEEIQTEVPAEKPTKKAKVEESTDEDW